MVKLIKHLALPILLGMWACGCITPTSQYDRAERAREKGEHLLAAQRYAKILKDRPGWMEARDKLYSSAREASHELIGKAELATRRDQPLRAAEWYMKGDALEAAASDIGLTLDWPEKYRQKRRVTLNRAIAHMREVAELEIAKGNWTAAYKAVDAALDKFEPSDGQLRALTQDRLKINAAAIDALLKTANQAAATGMWDRGVVALKEAETQFSPTPLQQNRISRNRAQLHHAWAKQEFEMRHFRAAYLHAAETLAVTGSEGDQVKPILKMQGESLEQGTKRVAVLPIWRTPAAMAYAPKGFVDEFTEVFHDEHATNPPLFLALVDDEIIAKQMRRFRMSRGRMSTENCVQLGEIIQADYVLACELTEFTRRENDVQVESMEAKTKNGGTASYNLRTGVLQITATAGYSVVEVSTRRLLEQDSVLANVGVPFKRAIYSGNIMDLDVPTDVRRLFVPDTDAVRDAEEKIIETLSERLANEAFAYVLDKIP